MSMNDGELRLAVEEAATLAYQISERMRALADIAPAGRADHAVESYAMCLDLAAATGGLHHGILAAGE